MKRFAPTLAVMLAALHAEAARTLPAPQWERHFAFQGVTGTFVLHEPAANRLLAFNESRAAERFLPASTFKIPNALIGLETGAVADEHEVFRWDGKPRRFDAWERDHTLPTAMRDSVVWVFQAIARRVGKPAMGEWLDRLEYGNRDMTGGVDLFWLQGGLRISALEQVEFLRKLGEGRLPVTARSRRIVREAMLSERCGDAVILGKTGTAMVAKDGIAWWVGWVERGGEPVAYFALNYRTSEETPRRARFEIGHAILEEAGVIPRARETCKAA
jgi:beta-lactamase class D